MDPAITAAPPTKASKKKRPSQPGAGAGAGDNGAAGDLGTSPGDHATANATADNASAASSFRNVSACNRCRTRKNRCDQQLPACSGCLKANVQCVGYDPVLKREIPRSYFFYLESRVQHLENILLENNIPFPPADDLSISLPAQSTVDNPSPALALPGTEAEDVKFGAQPQPSDHKQPQELVQQYGNIDKEQADEVSLQGFAGPDRKSKKTAISFASIVYSAVKKSMSTNNQGARSGKSVSGPTTAPRDSFFGLHMPSNAKPAPFPDRELAHRLMNLYFENNNPQTPVLHRGQFDDLIERIYATDPVHRSARQLFFLNIVCAIGAGIILQSADSKDGDEIKSEDQDNARRKRQRVSHLENQAEEFHAAATQHLGDFAASPLAIEATGHGLEELQAVLLLAGFALLRPTAPGLWYIVGVACRLAVDLGLHLEDPTDTDAQFMTSMESPGITDQRLVPNPGLELGRRQWSRDMRRRLWYSTYSLDRLVSVCVGRPVTISDTVITAEFPSLLDDKDITPTGFIQRQPSGFGEMVSYKHVSHHYFRLRLLQSEILQVLQHRQARIAFMLGKNAENPYVAKNLPSPFLANYPSFREWRTDVDRRLWLWKESAPTRAKTGVDFQPLYLELNYWQAVVMLYRHTLSVPSQLAHELDASTGEDYWSTAQLDAEDKADGEMVFLKVAEAGQRVLRIYRQLHRIRRVNYTYLATHHIFVCGISFLYAIWHSAVVRSKLNLDEVDLTLLSATSVLSDLVEKCPPAEACRDALKRMSRSTVNMCLKTTGFGAQAAQFVSQQNIRDNTNAQHPAVGQQVYPPTTQASSMQPPRYANNPRPAPVFDMGLHDLFEPEDLAQHNGQDARNQAVFRANMASPPQMRMPPMNTNWQIDPALQTPTLSTSTISQQDAMAQHQSSNDVDLGSLFHSPQMASSMLDPSGELDWDFGFNASGLAFDAGAGGSAWAGDGVDMFDGFFFGSGAGNGGPNNLGRGGGL